MSGREGTKSVFRMMMAWGDRDEERWLDEQARHGWHLKQVGLFRYTFDKGAPAEVAYRLDYGPTALRDRQEYFAIFRDAGWEHVGTRGLWQYFRKALVDGQVPEIHTDAHSRIAMYQRLIALMAVILGVQVIQVGTRLSGVSTLHPAFLVVQALLIAVFTYGIVRLVLVIARLKRLPKSVG
jgi:hypothetical protein